MTDTPSEREPEPRSSAEELSGSLYPMLMALGMDSQEAEATIKRVLSTVMDENAPEEPEELASLYLVHPFSGDSDLTDVLRDYLSSAMALGGAAWSVENGHRPVSRLNYQAMVTTMTQYLLDYLRNDHPDAGTVIDEDPFESRTQFINHDAPTETDADSIERRFPDLTTVHDDCETYHPDDAEFGELMHKVAHAAADRNLMVGLMGRMDTVDEDDLLLKTTPTDAMINAYADAWMDVQRNDSMNDRERVTHAIRAMLVEQWLPTDPPPDEG